MENNDIAKLAQELLKKHEPEMAIKENNKSVREYTKAEKMVFALAKKNLDALDSALKNAIISENDCANIIKEVQPVGDDFDKYFKIEEIISRYDGAWRCNNYKGKAPTAKRPANEPLVQINQLK